MITQAIPRPRTQLMWINYLLLGMVIALGTLAANQGLDELQKVYCVYQ